MNHDEQSEISHVVRPRVRYLPVLWVGCAGVGFSLAVFLLVHWLESRDIQTAFRIAAEDRSSAVKGAFQTELAMLELIRAAFTTAGQVQRDQFREVLTPFLTRSRSIQAVEWAPRVPDSRRSEYEAAARRDGIEGFRITELGAHGRLVPAAQRDEYFPVYFIGPRPGDKTVFGLDLASEPNRFDALRQAGDTGKTVASGLMAFVQDRQKQFGFLVYLPVYEKGKPLASREDRRENLRGCVLGVFRPCDMIEAALAQLQPEGIDVCLYDPSACDEGPPFYFHASRRRKQPRERSIQGRLFDPQGMHHLARLDVAGHPWTIVCLPTPDFVAAHRTWWPWGALAAGLGFTTMLAASFLSSIDRRAHAEQMLVEKRRYAQELEEKVSEQTVDLRRAQEEVIYRLVSASLWRDEETGMHIRRTGLVSEALARAADWSIAETDVIRQAAPMHDVGKIGIPDAILRKPDKLTAAEFEVMKTHTVIGAMMLEGSRVPMLQMAREIALNHHERWDGQGYPAGLAGQDIPESARIVAIADVYDALTHDRVYRPALAEDDVLAIMQQGAGTHFDPLLLTHFFAILPKISRIMQENPDEPRKQEAGKQSFASTWSDQATAEATAPAMPQ